jgi:FkbM family methyltransferase
MLASLTIDDVGGGLNVIDVGASGRLNRKWKPLQGLINLSAFEPNAAECARLASAPHGCHQARYFPYAVGGQTEEAPLFRTRSDSCCSLLPPRKEWFDRFSFGDLFDVVGIDRVQVHRLSEIEALQGLDLDAIKVDTQGLELPILAGADELLDRAFYVETETGFAENYRGETTYSQIDEFLRARGFLLFDLNVKHRVARRGPFAQAPTGKEQIMWCEAVWLKDYVALAARGELPPLTRGKALKALLLCALEECLDFGYELATLFAKRGLIARCELARLAHKRSWRLGRRRAEIVAEIMTLLPKRARRAVSAAIDKSIDRPDLVKALLQRTSGARAA